MWELPAVKGQTVFIILKSKNDYIGGFSRRALLVHTLKNISALIFIIVLLAHFDSTLEHIEYLSNIV